MFEHCAMVIPFILHYPYKEVEKFMKSVDKLLYVAAYHLYENVLFLSLLAKL